MAKEKEDELKIGEERREITEEPERVTPDVEADFMGLLKDYGVTEKAAKTITKHIAETGTPDIFEDPKQLLEKMARFPRHIPPVTRKNILDHWIATRSIPIPEGFEEESGLSAEELKGRKGKETAPAKYSVDSDTGAIKVASTTDKTALTWDEAEKLSKEIKKDLEEARKRQEAEGGGKELAKYSVDSDTGAIKVASTTDKTALTWDEAEKLSKEIKKDIEAKERESGGKEPTFILGEQGAWSLNPKAKIGFGEFAVFQMYQDSLKRGEPIDPLEELTKREEQSVRLREAMGVKKEDTEMTTLEKLDKLGMLKKSEGGEGALLSQLESFGLLRKPGEEGRVTQIDMLEKLDQLGLLKKTGEGDAASQTITGLQTEVKALRESLQKQEMDTLKNVVVSLSNQMSELRKDMSNQGKLEGRFALMDKTIGAIDSQLTGIRSDAKPLLSSFAGGGGGEPRKKSPEEKAAIAKGLKGAVALEKEAKALEDELLFGGTPQS